MNQSAERIIFSHNEDGTTTAVIQVLYSGPSERFAWMLPVQGTPEIGVSSNIAFTQLQQATNPNYRLQVEIEGECAQDPVFASDRGGTVDAASANDAGPSMDAGSSVDVVDSGSVGPYDYVNISVDPEAEDIAQVATDWLTENGYDVSELGRDRLVPYLESGMNLLAFRLTKGRSSGEIRPIALSFGEGLPSIPIRATAAAATSDMGVMVWVLGEHRAIPANYADLELNETRINWFNPGANYNNLVTLAAREAGGHGFVTEFSGDAEPFADTIWPSFIQAEWEYLQSSPSLLGIVGLLSGYDGLAGAILDVVTKPEGVSEEEWIAQPLFYISRLTPEEQEAVDLARLLTLVEESVVAPVRETAALFENAAKATRFYTTMSPEQMTLDPIFDFSPSLPDYSNQHVQTRVIECRSDLSQFEAPWRVEFGGGVVVRGEGRQWPLASDSSLPAARRVIRRGPDGGEDVRTDNAEVIAARLSLNNARFPTPARRDNSCSVGWHGGEAPAAAMLLGLALVWRRRA